MNGQQVQPPPAQTDPTKVVPTVDLIGTGGTVKVNQGSADYDRLRGQGYQTVEEYSASKAEEARNANKSNKGGSGAAGGESSGDKPETAKERKAREKREREAAEAREHSEDAKVGSGESKGDDGDPEFKG